MAFNPNKPAIDNEALADITAIHDNLIALRCCESSPTEPSNLVAGMWWFDTTANILKLRNEANSTWQSVWNFANNKPFIANLSAEITLAMMASSCADPAAGTAGLRTLGTGAVAAAAGDHTHIGVVAQSWLKSTYGTVSFSKQSGYPMVILAEVMVWDEVYVTNIGVCTENAILPGGLYGFYPQTYGGFVGLMNYQYHAKQQYIQSSPPYDLGDGEIPLFIFARMSKTGKIKSLYVAPDPPWANNGPTNISPDYVDAQGRGWKTRLRDKEIPLSSEAWERRLEQIKNPWDADLQFDIVDTSYKNSDMPLIPHPFIGNDLGEDVIVLIDPVSDLVYDLSLLHIEMWRSNESVAGLCRKYLAIGNEPLNRKGPAGVLTVAAKWK